MGEYKSITQIIEETFHEAKKEIIGRGKHVLDARIAENDKYVIYIASISEIKEHGVDGGTDTYHYLSVGVMNKKRRNEVSYGTIGWMQTSLNYTYSTGWYFEEKDYLKLSDIKFLEEDKVQISIQKHDSEIYKTYVLDLKEIKSLGTGCGDVRAKITYQKKGFPHRRHYNR